MCAYEEGQGDTTESVLGIMVEWMSQASWDVVERETRSDGALY